MVRHFLFGGSDPDHTEQRWIPSLCWKQRVPRMQTYRVEAIVRKYQHDEAEEEDLETETIVCGSIEEMVQLIKEDGINGLLSEVQVIPIEERRTETDTTRERTRRKTKVASGDGEALLGMKGEFA